MATQKLDNFQSIAEILVRRGLAASLEQAVEMVRAGKVVVRDRDYTQDRRPFPLVPTIATDPEKRYRFNEPIVIVGEAAASQDQFSQRYSPRWIRTPRGLPNGEAVLDARRHTISKVPANHR
jgi:hypothetical protein